MIEPIFTDRHHTTSALQPERKENGCTRYIRSFVNMNFIYAALTEVAHTVILSDGTLKKWDLSSFAF